MNISESTTGPDAVAYLQLTLGSEAGYYLEPMLEASPGQSIVEKFGGATVADDKKRDIATNVIKIIDEAGVSQIILNGAGPQIDKEMEARGLTPEKIDGQRVTDDEAMEIVAEQIKVTNAKLVDSLRQKGVNAIGITSDVFFGHQSNPETLKRVGDVDRVETEQIRSLALQGLVVVVGTLGVDKNNEPLNFNADNAGAAFVASLDQPPIRYVTLTDSGGVHDQYGRIIPVLDADGDDIERLISEGVITEGMIPKIRKSVEVLHALPEEASYVITSPSGMLRELFTHRGAGTLIKRGEPVTYHESLNGVDNRELRELIESSLGGVLVGDYFSMVPENAKAVATDRKYDGVAILFPGEMSDDGPMPTYMDKLAVLRVKQGYGIGSRLVRKAKEKHPEGIYWRARPDNPQIGAYDGMSDARINEGGWEVFASGVNAKLLRDCVQKAVSMPQTVEYPKST